MKVFNFKKKRIYFWLPIILGLFGYSVPSPVLAQIPPNLVPITISNNFETGELYGWEPYPYAQDIGYDALYFTQKEPTFNHSKYALARPVKAHDTVELSEGFTKRLNLWTTSDTRVKIAIYFQSDRDPERLTLSLGTFDGQLYQHIIKTPKANHWMELDLPVSSFKFSGQSLKTGEHIQVITLKGSYPIVYHLYTYTMLMDNFKINGKRQRRFKTEDPGSTTFKMFNSSILNKHYVYGDNIALSVMPEGIIPLQQVRGELVDSKGRVVKDNIRFYHRDSVWSNKSIYKFSKKDARGQWELRLIGQTENSNEVRWKFHFLMPGETVNKHPRLFFSANKLQQRIDNEQSPIAQRILKRAEADSGFMDVDVDSIKEGKDYTAENLTGGPYAKYTVGFDSYNKWRGPMGKLGNVIEKGSLRYAFTEDEAAGQQAKKALLKLCLFKKWNAAWMLEHKFWTYYPVGYTLTQVAYGYDMLFPLLSDQERRVVRKAIMEKGLKPFYRDMVMMNRMPTNMTNHIAVIVTGCGLAATAIYGDDPDNPYLEPYLSAIMTKAKTFIDRTYYQDGSYGEPKSGYMNMATRDLVKLLAAFERNFGVNWSTTTNMQDFYKYPLYATSPSGSMADFGIAGHNFTEDIARPVERWLMADFGDGHQYFGGFTQAHSEWFVHRTGNRFLYKYLKPYWQQGKGGYLGYLWFRNDLKPKSRRDLPTSKIFNAMGMVMRSGWENTSSIISTHIGPHTNHYHADQGSFQLMTNGNTLLADPGIGKGGYYANLNFQSYNIQAIAHNVMLVDHDPESQTPGDFDNGIKALNKWPRMTHTFAGEIADAVEGDLTSVYKNKLDSYTRTLLYTKSGPLFMFDRVKSAPRDPHVTKWLQNQYQQTPPPLVNDEGHEFDWLFHAPLNKGNQRSISYDAQQQRVTINRPRARLTMDVLNPRIVSGNIRDHDNESVPESMLRLESSPNLKEVNFFAVLVPEAKLNTGAYGPRPKTTRIDSLGWLGARVELPHKKVFGFFRTGVDTVKSIEGFSTDAKQFTASLDGKNDLYKAYFEGSHFFGWGTSVNAGHPITCAIMWGKETTQVELKSSQATTLTIRLNQRPSAIMQNGKVVHGWNYNSSTNTVNIDVPKGRYNMFIK